MLDRPTVRTAPIGARRVVVALGLVVATVAPTALGAEAASAAPAGSTTLALTDVSGTRVGRGAAAGSVRAVVRNTGDAVATGTTLRYRLPSGIDFVAGASTSGCVASGVDVTCSLGSIAPGDSTPVDIGVRESSPTAVLGTRTGYFLPPTSNGYDPGSGEVLQTTWYHEAGAEGTDLAECWPVGNASPNMDVAGGVCDGANDTAPLTADETTVLDAFPAPFAQSLVRSWQFETDVVAPATGSYRACGVLIDDGGYVAIAPVGSPLTSASVVVATAAYGSSVGAPFDLVGGERYRVVMRVSNRGGAGVDNGADGGTLAGWDAFGLAPASQPCAAGAAAVFGTADTAWVDRQAADVVVVGASDLRVLGAVESASVDGRRRAALRISNLGRDTTSAQVAFRLPLSAERPPTIAGCDRVATGPAPSCQIDAMSPADASAKGRVVSVDFAGGAGLGWSLTAPSTVDVDPTADSLG